MVPYPSIPLEDVYQARSAFHLLYSKHTTTLVILGVAFGLIIFVVAYNVYLLSTPRTDAKRPIAVTSITLPSEPQPSRVAPNQAIQETAPLALKPEVLAAMLSSFLALYAGIFHLMKLRLSTVDVFSSEILARLRILASDNSVYRIIHESQPEFVSKHARARPNVQDGILEPSKESQFETFFRRSNDLGSLSSVVVDHVTDFYSYHMAARDALRELSSTIAQFQEDSELIKDRLIDVIFMIDLMGYSGLRALEVLIENPVNKLHSRQVALSVCTPAINYLIENMQETDHRRSEVLRRAAKYESLIRELKGRIRPPLIGRGMVPRGQVFF